MILNDRPAHSAYEKGPFLYKSHLYVMYVKKNAQSHPPNET